MKNWFTSLNGAIALSMISLLVFLGRTLIDFYYVYREFNLDVGTVALAMLANMALFGGWIWALLSAVQGSRRGLISVLVLDLFFFFVIAVGTVVSYCPSPCRTAWPLGEITIWASVIFGLIASVSAWLALRKTRNE